MPVMKQAPSCAVTPLRDPIVWRRMPTSSIRHPAHLSWPTASSPQGSSALNMHKPCFQRWENQQPHPRSKRSFAGQRIRFKKFTQNQNQAPRATSILLFGVPTMYKPCSRCLSALEFSWSQRTTYRRAASFLSPFCYPLGNQLNPVSPRFLPTALLFSSCANCC